MIRRWMHCPIVCFSVAAAALLVAEAGASVVVTDTDANGLAEGHGFLESAGHPAAYVALESGGILVGDEIKLNLDVEADKKA